MRSINNRLSKIEDYSCKYIRPLYMVNLKFEDGTKMTMDVFDAMMATLEGKFKENLLVSAEPAIGEDLDGNLFLAVLRSQLKGAEQYNASAREAILSDGSRDW